MDIYGTGEAAAYLGVKLETLRYHLYVAEDLELDGRIGEDDWLVSPRQTLDEFRERRRPPSSSHC
jgi:hypothetical protein